MALWEPVEFPPPRPGQATVVPALPQGPSLGVLAEVMKAAGIPQAPSTPQVAAPAPVPATPMAEPPAPSAWPTDGVQPPPVNNDFFGRVLRGAMDANPILDAVPPDIKERALAIFRLYGDRAWRDNTVLGSTVSNIEAGGPKTVGQSWEAQRTASLMRNPEQPGILTEPAPAQPNAPAATSERSIAARRDYEINAAEKKSQLNALGPLSPIEQVTALLSSLVGSAGSPEIAIGPGAVAYAKAGTVGKMALGAGTNAAVVGLTDPANQMSAVARGDRKDYSPVEHAMATGGAAILGAAIPALGALFRRLGAIRPEAPPRADGPPALDGEILPPVAPAPEGTPRIEPPRAPVEAPSVKLRQPQIEAPPVEVRRDGYEIIRNPDAPRAEAPPARPAESATRPAIEAPPKAAEPAPARSEAPVEPAGMPVVREPSPLSLDTPAPKPDAAGMQTVRAADPAPPPSRPERDIVHEVGDLYVFRTPQGYEVRRNTNTHSVVDSTYAHTEDGLSIAKKRADYLASRSEAPQSLQNPRNDSPKNETIVAAEQPPDIPDFLRRTPKPAEKPVEAPAPVEPVRAPEAPKRSEADKMRGDSAVFEGAADLYPKGDETRARLLGNAAFSEARSRGVAVETARAEGLRVYHEAGGKEPHVALTADKLGAKPAPAAPADAKAAQKSGYKFIRESQKSRKFLVDHRYRVEAPDGRVLHSSVAVKRDRIMSPAEIRDVAWKQTFGRDAPKPDAAAPPPREPPPLETPRAAEPGAEAPKPANYNGPAGERVGGVEVTGGKTEIRNSTPEIPANASDEARYGHATAKQESDKRIAKLLEDGRSGEYLKPGYDPHDRATIEHYGFGKKPDAPKPDHPFTAKSDKPTEMHAGIGSAMLAKAVGPEIVGALVGGLVDHWERYGTPGISWQGALMGAATVAALRHRIPGVGRAVFGKGSYASSALHAGGDLMAKTRVGRWFHPTMGLPADLWERVVVKTKLETRNMQDDLLKIAKRVREEFTPAERALMSDWIEKAEQAQHGLTGFQAASARVRAQAEALAAHADDLGQKLADVGMIDRNSLLAEGTYLHRYYMDKQAADLGFREAAKRMQATASYAMRRGEQIEVKGAEKFKVGDKAVQWTNVQSGNVVYKTHGWNGGPEWFQSKEFTVESIDGAKMILHRDYTPAERDAMGEIRDANYRFTMGSMEASRDLALGRMFKDIAADPRWASATDPGGWKQVPKTNAQGTTVRKWGALAGMYVDPKVWSALDVIRKPWTSEEWGVTGRVVKGYLKALGAWKVGKTAYNPATHFNNMMGNVSLSMLTGEVTPTWVMRGIGELRRGGPAVEEARRAGLSLGREANLGDELTNIKVDVGLATGVSQVGTWGKLLDWYSNNALVRGYQHEDAIFKMGAYMRRRAAGETPEEAAKNVHKVFFDYGDVPLGVQAMRDSYSPFFTYTYKYGQVALRELTERPWRYAAAFGALSAIDMMSYGLLYGDKAKSAADYEQATMPKWLEGRSGFGAQKAITLPFKQKDTATGEDRSLKLNTRYMVPGGDLLDFTANGNFGPAIFPQALGNTILGGNPLVNFIYGIANGKDSFFDKPIQPYPSTGLWSVGERPTSEILANWGALARFAAFQSLPPILTSIPDKLGQAAVGEGLIDKKSGFADFMGWTGEDFAGRQKTVLQAIGSALGIKVEDINHAEQERFRESGRLRDVRESKAAMRRAYNNESMTESQRLGREKSLEDSIERMDREAQRIDDLRRKAGR